MLAITVTGVEEANGGSGFLGGLIAGFLAGYVTLLVKKYSLSFHKVLKD
ncbi:hypothetical protein [Planococcus sp. MB-3u-03]|nr:hypothetical protein [Planococcus sp. MB-3u-03]